MTTSLPLSYFERHKHRVATSLNPVGIALWEANKFGEPAITKETTSKVESQEDSNEV